MLKVSSFVLAEGQIRTAISDLIHFFFTETSPRAKHSKHDKMSAGSAGNSNASLHGTMKKPASTHRANDESTGLIQNSGLILPRKHQLDTSARVGQGAAGSNNLQYSRTLVAAL